MNSTLSTVPGRLDHPPQHLSQLAVRRVGPLDRLALHLGIALIKWGRRPRSIDSRERLALRYEQEKERRERERAAERLMLLTMSRR